MGFVGVSCDGGLRPHWGLGRRVGTRAGQVRVAGSGARPRAPPSQRHDRIALSAPLDVDARHVRVTIARGSEPSDSARVASADVQRLSGRLPTTAGSPRHTVNRTAQIEAA